MGPRYQYFWKFPGDYNVQPSLRTSAKPELVRFQCAHKSPSACWYADSNSGGLGWAKFSGDSAAAPRNPLWATRIQTTQFWPEMTDNCLQAPQKAKLSRFYGWNTLIFRELSEYTEYSIYIEMNGLEEKNYLAGQNLHEAYFSGRGKQAVSTGHWGWREHHQEQG